MTAFPINWRTGGIGWQRFNGVFSLYVALRFASEAQQSRPVGFILRVGPRSRALYRQRGGRWLLGWLQLRAY